MQRLPNLETKKLPTLYHQLFFLNLTLTSMRLKPAMKQILTLKQANLIHQTPDRHRLQAYQIHETQQS